MIVAPFRPSKTVEAGKFGATAVRFSTCGRFLAVAASAPDTSKHSSTNRSLLRVYRCKSNLPLLLEWQAHNGAVHSLVWSDDGTYVLTSSADGYVKLWNVCTLNIKAKQDSFHLSGELQLSPPSNISLCAAFFGQAKEHGITIVAGTANGELQLWKPNSNTDTDLLGCRVFHRSSVISLDTTNSRIFSCDASGIIIVWGTQPKGKEYKSRDDFEDHIIPLRTIDIHKELHQKAITGMVCSNSCLFITTSSGHLNIYDMTTQRVVPTRFNFSGNNNKAKQRLQFIRTHTAKNNALLSLPAVSPDGTMVAAANESEVCVWATYTGKLHARHQIPFSYELDGKSSRSISCLHWNPSMHLLGFCREGCDFPVLLFGKTVINHHKTT
jgi:WD40 repeat protein